MPVTSKYSLFGVQVGAALLGGITEQSIQTGTELDTETPAAQPYPKFLALKAQKPQLSFSTLHIAAAIDAISLLGADIANLAGYLNLWGQAHADGGLRAATSVHRKYTIRKGLLVPKMLTCRHGENATISYEGWITYDGSNDPVVVTDSQPLPGGLADAQRFTVHAAKVGNITLGQVTSLEIDFGLTVKTESAGSDVWPTFASIETALPKITLKGTDVQWLKAGAVPLTGLSATHANTLLYLRKRAEGTSSGYVANGTSEHVAFTAAGLAYVDNPIDANDQGAAEVTVVVQCKHDGTNYPILVDTTAAIV